MLGVAISTHARPAVLAKSLAGWAKFTPDLLIVVHDVYGAGVAATKNRSIQLLMDAGVEHLYLADDDMHPVSPDWTMYAQDPANHLMHCWGKSRLVSDDGHYTTWSWPRGVMLYCHRSVIDTVGGMRLDFGPRGGGEHAEFSRRIHNAGFTKAPFMDLTQARDGVWHCEDYTRSIPSTIGSAQLEATKAHRHDLYRKYRDSTDFVDYRC